jgi:Protein of unknown function (DUF2934)
MTGMSVSACPAEDPLRNRRSVLHCESGHEHAGHHPPTLDEIQLRAYRIHREHGGLQGYTLDDWLEAERELNESSQSDSERTNHAHGAPSGIGLEQIDNQISAEEPAYSHSGMSVKS